MHVASFSGLRLLAKLPRLQPYRTHGGTMLHYKGSVSCRQWPFQKDSGLPLCAFKQRGVAHLHAALLCAYEQQHYYAKLMQDKQQHSGCWATTVVPLSAFRWACTYLSIGNKGAQAMVVHEGACSMHTVCKGKCLATWG